MNSDTFKVSVPSVVEGRKDAFSGEGGWGVGHPISAAFNDLNVNNDMIDIGSSYPENDFAGRAGDRDVHGELTPPEGIGRGGGGGDQGGGGGGGQGGGGGGGGGGEGGGGGDPCGGPPPHPDTCHDTERPRPRRRGMAGGTGVIGGGSGGNNPPSLGGIVAPS